MLGCGDEPGVPLAGDSGDTASAASSDAPATAGEDDTAGSDESGGDTMSDMEICEAYCAWEVGCYAEYPIEQCMDDCLYNLGVFDDSEECDAAFEKILICAAEFEACEPSGLTPDCEAADEMLTECESPGECHMGFNTELDYSSCTAISTCNPSDPATLEMHCDSETCTCFENGEATGECPALGACMTIDPYDPVEFEQMVGPFVEECCGWVDFGDPANPHG